MGTPAYPARIDRPEDPASVLPFGAGRNGPPLSPIARTVQINILEELGTEQLQASLTPIDFVPNRNAMEQIPQPSPAPQSLAEARAFIDANYGCTLAIETVPLAKAEGRILAEDIVAPGALPRFSASAMDGYAVRDDDFPNGVSTVLRVVGTAKAGHPYRLPIGPGQAVRIFTGAVVPEGADRVIMQEDCQAGNGTVSPETPPSRKRHIRHPGEDVREGQALLGVGTRLSPAHLALLSALQILSVKVRRHLRVALLSNGDELRHPGDSLEHAQIVDTNGPYLNRQIGRLGSVVDDRGIVPDDSGKLLATLIAASADNDLVITSGGASVGAEDHLKQLISKRGYLEFWRLHMKPGKPVGLGDVDECPILILPGNPVAAAVAFHFLGQTLIARLAGVSRHDVEGIRLPLASPVKKTTDRLEILAAKLVRTEDGNSMIEVLPMQGSASLLSLAMAEGWVIIPGSASASWQGPADYFPIGL